MNNIRKSEEKRTEIDEIYSGLREYGYTMREILTMNETVNSLAGLLRALKEEAAKPGSPEWVQFKVEEQLKLGGSHTKDGRRVHFCKHCGKPIVFGSEEEVAPPTSLE